MWKEWFGRLRKKSSGWGYNSVTGLLCLGIVVCGTCNTLMAKFQDESMAKGNSTSPPKMFEHPFFQSFLMFIAEVGLYFFSFARKKKGARVLEENKERKKELKKKEGDAAILAWVNPLYFSLPSVCDLISTTLMNVGLILTYASIYQMMRGMSTVFNCVLSVLLLKSKRYIHHWFGIVAISTGLFIVGLYSFDFGKEEDTDDDNYSEATSPFVGALLVLIAQVFTAMQLVIEEKIVRKYPKLHVLKIIGYEGFWGLVLSVIMMWICYWIPGEDYGSFENFPSAIAEMVNNPLLILWVCLYLCSIFVFNICGINVTKRINSTSRATVNSLRTITIWGIQLLRGKEKFNLLQLSGFAVLILGTFLYNEVITIPFYKEWYNERRKKDKKTKAPDPDSDSNEKKVTAENETYKELKENEEEEMTPTEMKDDSDNQQPLGQEEKGIEQVEETQFEKKEDIDHVDHVDIGD